MEKGLHEEGLHEEGLHEEGLHEEGSTRKVRLGGFARRRFGEKGSMRRVCTRVGRLTDTGDVIFRNIALIHY